MRGNMHERWDSVESGSGVLQTTTDWTVIATEKEVKDVNPGLGNGGGVGACQSKGPGY